jgi:hypothetical protein
MPEENHAISNAKDWLEEITTLVVKLHDDGLTDEQREQVRDEIQEGPLSVMVRDGWRSPGGIVDSDNSAEEYEILLSTGGPALRIFGKLDRGEPDEWPRLQWQDWGIPWTDYPLGEEREAVQSYAQQFYFGD